MLVLGLFKERSINQENVLTHWCFDVGVRVRELWEVAGDVSRMCAFLSG